MKSRSSTSRYKTRIQEGSALLMVLWVIGFLSFLIITSMMVMMQDVETISSRETVFRARQLAEMGLAVGAHPAIKPNDPLLHRKLSSSESYDVLITSEESRLNINALLTEERKPVLEKLFTDWGLAPQDAETAVESLLDWVDIDDAKHLRGAERDFYKKTGFPDRPFNRPFASLDEVELVNGFEMIANANPRWRDSFTLWGAGQLDINEAPADLIATVTGAQIGLAQALVKQRNGADGIPHTKDDEPIQSIEEAMTRLGVSGDAAAKAAALLSVHGATVRVQCLGQAGGFKRGLGVVLQKNGATTRIMEWREFVPE
jgi:type II secretory pathway component PulK